MIKVTVIAIGRLKEKYLCEAMEEYSKRLSRFAQFQVVELEPIRLPEKPSEAEISAALEKEADMLIKKLPQNGFNCALCVEGKQFSSPQFADLIEQNSNEGKNITFIIGSSYGLADRVKKACHMRLSISEMTFPHQLFRVMLSEQIYRAFMINQGSTYHK